VQGYNAQAVVTGEQIVIAAEISTESLDTADLQPMVLAAEEEPHAAGVVEVPGVALADAGYWKNSAIEALCGEGIPTLVAPDADRRRPPRPGRRDGLDDFTRRVLKPDWGKQLYLKRQGSVEPCSDRSRATAVPIASYAADARQSDPNGGCQRPPTTCSSSTGTSSPPPDRGRRHPHRPYGTIRIRHLATPSRPQRKTALRPPTPFRDTPSMERRSGTRRPWRASSTSRPRGR
jgi:hypothetical protein